MERICNDTECGHDGGNGQRCNRFDDLNTTVIVSKNAARRKENFRKLRIA